MKKLTAYYLLTCCLLPIIAFGQNSLKSSVKAINDRNTLLPAEKVYLQLDKPYYTVGDTLYFKSYVFNADFLTPTTRSGLLYVELDDEAEKMVKRMMVPLVSGVSWSNIALDQKEIPEGRYTLRAYTNWMRNFGEDYIFKKSIYISPLNDNATLVNAGFKLDSVGGKNKINANLNFTGLDGIPLRLLDMQLKVKAGNKTLYRDKAATGMDGSMRLNFDLADKTAIRNLSIQARQTGKNADTSTLIIPVTVNRPENTDVQFMPEGGNMVAGIAAKVGFKALGEDGKGANFSGKIYDSRQQQIATFNSTHAGMGSFEVLPQPGEAYTAKITLPGGTIKTYPLPAVNGAGTTLRVNQKGDDSLEVVLNISPGLININTAYYLVAQSRGVVCYAATISFKENMVKKTIAKQLFAAGIAHFTLLNSANQPLNERIVYINRNDNLQMDINAAQTTYATRDSVALNMQVTDKAGKPVQGNFSLAVTDDSQVKTDSTAGNIINNLLFTSDLKGDIEEPGWYFENNTLERIAALDNLMLTQGWIGYDWKNIFTAEIKTPKYSPESEFIIQGKLTNIFNKPLKQTVITLLQKQPLLALDTVTDNEGIFIFKSKGLIPSDTSAYIIQVKDKDGTRKDFNVGIALQEFIPPVFAPSKQRLLPWYVNSDTLLLNNTGTKIAQLKAEANYKGEGKILNEVKIRAKKIIKDSHNLNGPGEADITIDEPEIKKSTGLTLLELLEKKFGADFRKKILVGHPFYTLFGERITFAIDGDFLEKIRLPIELYMNTLMASDIKGIEIMSKSVLADTYESTIAFEMRRMRSLFPPTYLEITTYSGHGAFLQRSSGRYIYKPVAYGLAKEFYRPRYMLKNSNTAMGTDLRSTIHWEPNVATDTTGKATVSFFSADKPTGYTIIMEGTDLNGNVGYHRQKIKVASKPIVAK